MGISAGTVLEREHLALKKPGSGIPAGRVDDLVGHRLVRSKERDELIMSADLEEFSL